MYIRSLILHFYTINSHTGTFPCTLHTLTLYSIAHSYSHICLLSFTSPSPHYLFILTLVTPTLSRALQAMDLLSGLIPCEEHESGQTSVQLTPEHLERLYIFAVMWSVGALLELDDRAKMEQFMREQVEVSMRSNCVCCESNAIT